MDSTQQNVSSDKLRIAELQIAIASNTFEGNEND